MSVFASAKSWGFRRNDTPQTTKDGQTPWRSTGARPMGISWGCSVVGRLWHLELDCVHTEQDSVTAGDVVARQQQFFGL